MASRAPGRIYMKIDFVLIKNQFMQGLQRMNNMTSDTGVMKSFCFSDLLLQNKLFPWVQPTYSMILYDNTPKAIENKYKPIC